MILLIGIVTPVISYNDCRGPLCLKTYHFKRKGESSNHLFQGRAVSFRGSIHFLVTCQKISCLIMLWTFFGGQGFGLCLYVGHCPLKKYGGFLKWWYPQNTPKWSFLVGKPLVVGYHHFRKHPFVSWLRCFVDFCQDFAINSVFAFHEICSEELRVEQEVREVLRKHQQGTAGSRMGMEQTRTIILKVWQ